jgi:hypothetical protein
MKKSPLYYKSGGRPGEGSPISQMTLPVKYALFDAAVVAGQTAYDVKTDKSNESTWEKTKKHGIRNVGETLISYIDTGIKTVSTPFPVAGALNNAFGYNFSDLVPAKYGGTKKQKTGRNISR